VVSRGREIASARVCEGLAWSTSHNQMLNRSRAGNRLQVDAFAWTARLRIPDERLVVRSSAEPLNHPVDADKQMSGEVK
jgi:hypothetical protein